MPPEEEQTVSINDDADVGRWRATATGRAGMRVPGAEASMEPVIPRRERGRRRGCANRGLVRV